MSNKDQDRGAPSKRIDRTTKSKKNPNESRRSSQRNRSALTPYKSGMLDMLDFSSLTHESTYLSYPGGTAYLVGDEEDAKPNPRKGKLEITVHYVMKYDLIDILDDKEAILDFQIALGATPVQYVFEGVRNRVPKNLDHIWTDVLFVTNDRGDVASGKAVIRKREIRLRELFRTMPGQGKPVRTVLTTGPAGVGKTVSTKKYALDWSRTCTDDREVVVPFRLKDFNPILGSKVNFLKLIQGFFTELAEVNEFNIPQVLFVLDGVDEFKCHLDFKNNEVVTDANWPAPIEAIVTSLISGHLLPLARVWITSRPAAGRRIPPSYLDRVTELRGFTRPNREAYFTNRYARDEPDLALRIIKHIRTHESLTHMCHLPVFCWMTATVLELFFHQEREENIPITGIEMYMIFLAIQCKRVE